MLSAKAFPKIGEGGLRSKTDEDDPYPIVITLLGISTEVVFYTPQTQSEQI